MTNAQRFIKAYNTIDQSLRSQYNYKRSMSYSDVIRRSVAINYIVRKYEDSLIDYGRLRNAIIHKSNEDYIIAEPHEEVTSDFERIARLISTPPTALEKVGKTKVVTAQANTNLRDIIKLMSDTGYSNLPIYEQEELIGVINGQKIIDNLGVALQNEKRIEDYISNTYIRDIVEKYRLPYNYYEVLESKTSISDILNEFYKNRKLQVILITKNGESQEKPYAIITASDMIEFNNIIDSF